MVLPGPKQPFGAGSVGRPATPVSPDEKKMEWPWSPSFMNLGRSRKFHRSLTIVPRTGDSSLITLTLLIVLRFVVLLATV